MIRYLPALLAAVLTAAPAGAGVGVGLEVGVGYGLLTGSVAYGLTAAWVVVADIWPNPNDREAR